MPLTRIRIIRGLISLSCGYSSPHFSKMPRPKFSTSTSDFFASSHTSARPFGVCMLTVKDFLPRWSFMKSGFLKSGFLFQSFGSSPRWPSPRKRVSQRITSAPNSPSTRATVGPAAPVVSSMTRIPSRGNLLIKFFPTGVMEYWSDGVLEKRSTPIFHYSITPVYLSDHSLGSERDEIVVVHAQLVHVNFLVVLTEQRCRSINAAGSFHQPRHNAELLVLADHRVLHVNE